MTNTLPPVLGGVAPYLGVNGAGKAADFYVKALAATEVNRMPPDEKGRYMHIHLLVNGWRPTAATHCTCRSTMPTPGGSARSRPAPSP
jgi:uncharacterized glyoxalase superfamily protein PhnB